MEVTAQESFERKIEALLNVGGTLKKFKQALDMISTVEPEPFRETIYASAGSRIPLLRIGDDAQRAFDLWLPHVEAIKMCRDIVEDMNYALTQNSPEIMDAHRYAIERGHLASDVVARHFVRPGIGANSLEGYACRFFRLEDEAGKGANVNDLMRKHGLTREETRTRLDSKCIEHVAGPEADIGVPINEIVARYGLYARSSQGELERRAIESDEEGSVGRQAHLGTRPLNEIIANNIKTPMGVERLVRKAMASDAPASFGYRVRHASSDLDSVVEEYGVPRSYLSECEEIAAKSRHPGSAGDIARHWTGDLSSLLARCQFKSRRNEKILEVINLASRGGNAFDLIRNYDIKNKDNNENGIKIEELEKWMLQGIGPSSVASAAKGGEYLPDIRARFGLSLVESVRQLERLALNSLHPKSAGYDARNSKLTVKQVAKNHGIMTDHGLALLEVLVNQRGSNRAVS